MRKSLAAYRDLETAVRIYILLGGLFGAGSLTWIIASWTRVSKWSIEPLTRRIIPINPLSILLSTGILVLTYYLHKLIYKKPKYIDYKIFLWKVTKNRAGYLYKVYCKNDIVELNHIRNHTYVGGYSYRCEDCGETHLSETKHAEEQSLKSKINDFGINYFKNNFVNITKRIKLIKT